MTLQRYSIDQKTTISTVIRISNIDTPALTKGRQRTLQMNASGDEKRISEKPLFSFLLQTNELQNRHVYTRTVQGVHFNPRGNEGLM